MVIVKERIGPRSHTGLTKRQKCWTCGKEADIFVINLASGRQQCRECYPQGFDGVIEEPEVAFGPPVEV